MHKASEFYELAPSRIGCSVTGSAADPGRRYGRKRPTLCPGVTGASAMSQTSRRSTFDAACREMHSGRQTQPGENMTGEADVAVIGGGIVGIAHAFQAARRGLSVVMFERDPSARGASVRNFGMIWPIGQPAGAAHRLALRSREMWMEVAAEAGLWADPCGSLHVARRDDEWAVLEEFAALGPESGYDCELLSGAEVARRFPAANPAGLVGGLWSPAEVNIDPRQAIEILPRWLEERYGVVRHCDTPVCGVSMPWVTTAAGDRWKVRRSIVCTGSDLRTLFPSVYEGIGIRLCKLRMLATVPQPAGWRVGVMLAGGLTLQHYPAFAGCKSLDALKRRLVEETPEVNRWGIHVMVSQNSRGECILGDSHEYGPDVEPFDNADIEQIMLDHLHKLASLRDWQIGRRWHGVYAKHPSQVMFVASPQPEAHVVNAAGGTGMTLSFAAAERLWDQWEKGVAVGAPLGGEEPASGNPIQPRSREGREDRREE
jgi:FAD dependent oxidoreductase TIGR03364